MDLQALLRKLLPGFLPIIIFIIADEVWGTKIGLIVAISFGVLGLFYYGIKEKRFDKFIFFDTLLIVILGVISIVLNNDVFFKIKPAALSLIMCCVLAISAFSSKNLVFAMSKRYMGDLEFSAAQEQQMVKMLRFLFFIFLGYTVLSFYSVWYMSKEAWAFINGGFLYIIFGVVILVQFGAKWMKNYKYNKEEWLPLVNKNGEVIGKAPRSKCHADKALMHPVVHLHVLNENGNLYLQKRAMHKLVQPGKWDTAVGGHIAFGEKLEESLEREAYEEIGISNFVPKLAIRYVWESEIETEYVFSFITNYNKAIVIPSDEVEEGRFWAKAEIEKQLGKGVFTPNFEHEYQLLKKVIQH